MGLDISLIYIEDTPQENCLLAEDWPELQQIFADNARNKKIDYLEDADRQIYYYTEIAYQRKGVTEAFYKNVAADACLVKKEQVVSLLTYMDDEHRDSFQKEFIDAFIEGKTVVLIGW